MVGEKKSKQQRQEEQRILDDYHQWVTEEALEPLFQDFLKWKQGALPYQELTESIHGFHKKNQDIWKEFEYTKRDYLVVYAKMKLGRLTQEDRERYGQLLSLWEYEE